MYTDIHTDLYTEVHTDIHSDVHTDIHTDAHTDIHSDVQNDIDTKSLFSYKHDLHQHSSHPESRVKPKRRHLKCKNHRREKLVDFPAPGFRNRIQQSLCLCCCWLRLKISLLGRVPETRVGLYFGEDSFLFHFSRALPYAPTNTAFKETWSRTVDGDTYLLGRGFYTDWPIWSDPGWSEWI